MRIRMLIGPTRGQVEDVLQSAAESLLATGQAIPEKGVWPPAKPVVTTEFLSASARAPDGSRIPAGEAIHPETGLSRKAMEADRSPHPPREAVIDPETGLERASAPANGPLPPERGDRITLSGRPAPASPAPTPAAAPVSSPASVEAASVAATGPQGGDKDETPSDAGQAGGDAGKPNVVDVTPSDDKGSETVDVTKGGRKGGGGKK